MDKTFTYFGHQGELGDGSIVAKDGSSDFGTGAIFDIFQSFGTTPWDREHSNKD